MQKLISLTRQLFRFVLRPGVGWPHKKVNEVLAPFVHQSRYRPFIQVVETPTDQRKPVSCEINYRGREIELCVGGVLQGYRAHFSVIPVMSSSGWRPAMMSTSSFAVPHDIVHPMCPWPVFRYRFL